MNSGANLTLNRMILRNGRINLGGGIYNTGTLRLTEVSVDSNTATTGGGGIYNSGVNTVTLHRSAVINNVANSYGGGIANAGGTVHVVNSTISGNAANGTGGSSGGGAIDSYGTAPVLSFWNSTITNNTAVAPNTAKSGIWMESGNADFFNTIIANNNGANNCRFEFGTNWGYNPANLDNGTTCGFTGAVGQNTNPLLAALANNGGPTLTHALLPGSPAISGGINTNAIDVGGAPLTTDQRGAGFPRISGLRVDVGAFEVACPTFPTTVPAGDSTALIDAIACANSTTANDVINLASASTYTLTTESAFEIGLPPIVSTATGGTLTINGNGATITRSSAGGTPDFRLFSIAPAGNLTLSDLQLANGSTAGNGGAVYNDLGSLNLNRVDVRDNRASGGGALFNASGGMYVDDSTIRANTASSYGGGIASSGGSLSIVNSTVSGNAANGDFGGSGGGAVDLYGGTTALISQSTIANNTAVVTATSGIWQESGTLTIRNSIVANNNGANNCAFTVGTRADSGGNLDNGTTCGFTGAVGQNTNPLLAALANNGGPTQTHALQSGSPAISAGIDANAVDQTGAPLTTDQRGAGFARIRGASVDIGAFEATLSTLEVFLSLQGRSNAKPHASYATTVQVTVMPAGGGAAYFTTPFGSNQSGTFTIRRLPIGTYLFRFKGEHTLAVQYVLTIGNSGGSIETEFLREGDADNNNVVNITDFSLLAAAFGKASGQGGFDARADFNQDGVVNITDFSLLAASFGQAGAG